MNLFARNVFAGTKRLPLRLLAPQKKINSEPTAARLITIPLVPCALPHQAPDTSHDLPCRSGAHCLLQHLCNAACFHRGGHVLKGFGDLRLIAGFNQHRLIPRLLGGIEE